MDDRRRDRDRDHDRRDRDHDRRDRDRDRDRGRDRYDRGRDRDRRDRGRREERDFDRDRRGGGRIDRGFRDDRKRSASRSPSPPPRKRRRERTSTGWDQTPSLTAPMQIVGSGLMPLPAILPAPSADSTAVMVPSAATLNLAGIGGLLNPSQVRQAKRIYCGNTPPNYTDKKLAEFFHSSMFAANLISKESLEASEQDPDNETACYGCVLAVQVNNEKNFAFVEFRTAEDASGAISLDGITLEGNALKLRRPKDYVPLPEAPAAVDEKVLIPGIVSTNVPDTEHKVFCGGLPTYLNEEQVKELLSSYGPLKSFNLVKDPATGLSKGFAFCEFVDHEITDIACEGLHGMQLQDKTLVVQRAHVGARGVPLELPAGTTAPSLEDLQNPGVQTILNVHINAAAMLGALVSYSKKASPSCVLQVLNLFSREDLVLDDEYLDILRDVEEEAGKYGRVVSLIIPRPRVTGKEKDPEDDLPDSANDPPGVGRAFVEYESKQAAEKGLHSLGGRKYNGRTVITAYFDREKYLEKRFND